MIKIKNKMYQPLLLLIDGKTIVIPSRKSMMINNITPQMAALKAQGLLQIIKK